MSAPELGRTINNHTDTQYGALQRAYDHFNRELFGGALPGCLITIHRKANATGYFIGDVFAARDGHGFTSEIALNPETFEGRTDREILSTLAHEMAHLQQHVSGKPGDRGYHNKEWAGIMAAIGLQPTDTGSPGGKDVGFKMTHYIVSGDRFDRAVDDFVAQNGNAIHWHARTNPKRDQQKALSAKSKSKFTCPGCGQNSWAKPTANLLCADCETKMKCSDSEPGDDRDVAGIGPENRAAAELPKPIQSSQDHEMDLCRAAGLAITALSFAQETYQANGDAYFLALMTDAKNALIMAQNATAERN